MNYTVQMRSSPVTTSLTYQPTRSPPMHCTTSTRSVERYSLESDPQKTPLQTLLPLLSAEPLPSNGSSTVGYLRSFCITVAVVYFALVA
jgi:hypothetical protein